MCVDRIELGIRFFVFSSQLADAAYFLLAASMLERIAAVCSLATSAGIGSP